MELLYFSDSSQLDYVLEVRPELLRSMRPITGDMVVSFELERLGIEFIDEWNLIEPEEIQNNWNDAYVLSKSWWDEGLANTLYGVEALTESAQQDMVYPFQACLNARTSYSRLFSLFSVEKIHGFFLPSVAVIRTGPAPTSRAVRSVSEAVLIFMAEKRGIPFEKLNSHFPLSLGKATDFGNSVTNKLKADITHALKNATEKTVLVFKDGLRASEFASIIEALGSLLDVKTVSISQQDLEIGAQFNSTRLDEQNRLDPFWRKFYEFSKSYVGDFPEIFANTHLHFQFERIKTEMEAAADCGDVFAALLDTLKPGLVIFGFESLTIERVLVGVAQIREVFVLSMLHGGVLPIMGIRGVAGRADKVMVWNNSHIQAISSYGIDHSRLKEIGCIQYENCYYKYIEKFRERSLPYINQKSKIRLGFDADKPLVMLVTAEITTGFAAAVANSRKHRDAIREFIALVDARQDLQFVIKPHPSFDYYELYRRLLAVCRTNLKFLENSTLTELIEVSDICLMINYCTTASLEAMLHHIPVVYLNNAVYPLSNWQDNLSETGIRRVDSMIEMEKEIDCLLTNPKAKQYALAEAHKQIKEILGVEGGRASDRFIEFVSSTLNEREMPNGQGFFSSQVGRSFLYPGEVTQSINLYTKLVKTHSSDILMYVFTYLAGVNSLGLYSIRRIYSMCYEDAKNAKLSTWSTARWELMPVYIKGSLSNSGYDHLSISKLLYLLPYLVHPHKLIKAEVSVRKNVLKYLLFCIFGHRIATIKQFTFTVRKIYFGLIR